LTLSCFIMISTIYGLNCYHAPREKPVHPVYHRLLCSRRRVKFEVWILFQNQMTSQRPWIQSRGQMLVKC
jgi:hypothetical protein